MELEFLQKAIADVLHVDPREVSEDTTFQEDLCADSLDLFQIAADVEAQYDIRISPEEFVSIGTVSDVIRLIRQKTMHG